MDRTRFASAAALGMSVLIGCGVAPPAQAGYVVMLTQEGGDVVATGSGPIDLTGLSFSWLQRKHKWCVSGRGNT
jgi:hypothetical protein